MSQLEPSRYPPLVATQPIVNEWTVHNNTQMFVPRMIVHNDTAKNGQCTMKNSNSLFPWAKLTQKYCLLSGQKYCLLSGSTAISSCISSKQMLYSLNSLNGFKKKKHKLVKLAQGNWNQIRKHGFHPITELKMVSIVGDLLLNILMPQTPALCRANPGWKEWIVTSHQ